MKMMSGRRARSEIAPSPQVVVASRRAERRPRWLPLLAAAMALALSGCDQLGIDTPQKTAERQQADAKAIGGACRHAMRAIEDCYSLNPQADKAAVFGGWRDMDEYMRENKLDGIAPVVPRPPPVAASKPGAGASKPKPKSSTDSEDEEDVEEEAAESPPAKGARKAKAS